MTELATINRIAVMLIPTEVCLDWINSYDDDKMTLDEIQKEPTVFLLPQGRGESEGQIRRHFKAMFEEELDSVVHRPDDVAQRPVLQDVQEVLHRPDSHDGVRSAWGRFGRTRTSSMMRREANAQEA